MSSQQRWATVGKVFAATAAAAALAVSVIQILQAVSGPKLVALVDTINNVSPPKARDKFVGWFDRKALLEIIESLEKRGASPGQVVLHLKELSQRQFSDSEIKRANLDVVLDGTAWHVIVVNTSSRAAENVQLIVPGHGLADILDCDCGTPDFGTAPLEWRNQITIGSIAPGGRAQVLIWPDRAQVRSARNIGLVHASGSVKVRESQSFMAGMPN